MQATKTKVKTSDHIPDWVTRTPWPEGWPPYVLLVQDSGEEHPGQHLQTVEVTREEFIALKRHLATMRGLTVPAAVQ